ncbi:coA-transferase III family protein [Mycobacterium xenopi 4042]|uniref:CoA-transferase III family protein n=1 Tax=Mycobacterium xenopi 4042 TaxID=1299334 RepID=X8E4V6_MYCXE|nr:coA-transferase III family protein [Mycobacterium xenopi 4042]
MELASWTYVPAAGVALADWGADVIKVESVTSGDPEDRSSSGFHPPSRTRRHRLHPRVEQSRQTQHRTGSEDRHRSRDLRPAPRSGRRAAHQLAAGGIGAGPPDGRRHSALQSEHHHRARNRTGVRGPDRDRGGFDAATYLARGGVAYTLTPFGTEHPAVQGPAFGDLQAGITLAGGICGALFHRQRTGEPTIVDSSLLAQAMWSIAPSISVADLFDVDGIPGAAPGLAINPLVNRYKTKDGRWIQLVFLQPDKFWAGFCQRIGLPELATDERFVPSSNLITNAAEATAIISAKFAEHDLAHWREALAEEPGVWAPLATPEKCFTTRRRSPMVTSSLMPTTVVSSTKWSQHQCNSTRRRHRRREHPSMASTPRKSCWSLAMTGTTSPRPKTAARSCNGEQTQSPAKNKGFGDFASARATPCRGAPA